MKALLTVLIKDRPDRPYEYMAEHLINGCGADGSPNKLPKKREANAPATETKKTGDILALNVDKSVRGEACHEEARAPAPPPLPAPPRTPRAASLARLSHARSLWRTSPRISLKATLPPITEAAAQEASPCSNDKQEERAAHSEKADGKPAEQLPLQARKLRGIEELRIDLRGKIQRSSENGSLRLSLKNARGNKNASERYSRARCGSPLLS